MKSALRIMFVCVVSLISAQPALSSGLGDTGAEIVSPTKPIAKEISHVRNIKVMNKKMTLHAGRAYRKYLLASKAYCCWSGLNLRSLLIKSFFFFSFPRIWSKYRLIWPLCPLFPLIMDITKEYIVRASNPAKQLIIALIFLPPIRINQ